MTRWKFETCFYRSGIWSKSCANDWKSRDDCNQSTTGIPYIHSWWFFNALYAYFCDETIHLPCICAIFLQGNFVSNKIIFVNESFTYISWEILLIKKLRFMDTISKKKWSNNILLGTKQSSIVHHIPFFSVDHFSQLPDTRTLLPAKRKTFKNFK